MSTFLAWLGTLLVIVLGALFAVPHFVDWNIYRGVFEEEASRVLGREVRVSGAVNVRLLPVPYLRFEKLRVADPASFSGEPLFRADSITMWLSVPPLLRGILEANQVELSRPEVRLAVDRNGRPNWSTLSVRRGELPFVPADVALRAVSISDGRASFERTGDAEVATLEGIMGTVSGESLEGPYKFAGTAKWSGHEREVRLATARPDPDGALRFKATVKVPGTASNYVFDGRLADLAGRATLAGELTAKLDVASLGLVSDPPAAASAAERPVIDLKSRLEGDLNEARLSDIVMSFEHVGQPQLLTGTGKVAWGQSPSLEVALESRWLDIDRLAATGTSARPVATALSVAERLLGSLPDQGKVAVRLTVDQVSIGGDAVSGLDVALARESGGLRLTGLSASLPGGTHFDLSGTIQHGGTETRFRGPVTLGGSSLQRLLGWATRSQTISNSFPDGIFTFQGDLALDEKSIEIAEARGELAGTPLRGSLRSELAERRHIAIELEGYRVETAWLWPGGGGLARLGSILLSSHKPGEPSAPTAAPAWLDPSETDLSVRLMAGRLIDGERVLEDVRADLAAKPGSLSISGLSFKTRDGLAVDLEGDLNLESGRSGGSLRGAVSAKSPAAVRDFHDISGLGEALPRIAALSQSLAPFDIAGAVELAPPGKGALALELDGIANGGRFISRIALDKLDAEWRSAPATVSVLVSDANVADILTRAFVASGVQPVAARAPARGILRLDAAGVPSTGMLTAATVTAADELAIAFEGRTRVTDSGWLDADGDLDLHADDAGMLLAWTGLDARLGAGSGIHGRIALARHEGQLTLRPSGLALSGSQVSGEVRIAAPASEAARMRLDADLSVDSARIPALVAILLEGPSAEQASGPDDGIDSSVWSARAFRNPLVADTEGRVTARFDRLELDAGLAITSARLEAEFDPSRVNVTRLEGAAVGGKLSASVAITKSTAGAAVSGTLDIADGRLEALGGTGTPVKGRAQGPISLTLAFSGQALGPRGALATLKGKGEARLGSAAITGLAPESIKRVTEAALVGRVPASGVGLVKAIKDELAHGELPLGPSEIPIEIVDGALRFAAAAIETNEGRTTVETTIDLVSLKADSEWTIEAKGRKSRQAGALWPGVKVVYVGQLGAVASMEPRISAVDLERELTVSRMELEVDELERLRKLDESRVRQERQRQKALDEERARGGAGWAPIPGGTQTAPNVGPGPAPAGTPKPGAAVEFEPLAPVTAAQPADDAAAPTSAASPVPAPRPAQPRPRSRRSPTAAETMMQGLMPP